MADLDPIAKGIGAGFGGFLMTWLGKRFVDRRRAVPSALPGQFKKIEEALAEINTRLQKGDVDMAVMTERMATKADLTEAIEHIGAQAKSMAEAVSRGLSQHIIDHAKGEFRGL